MNIRTGLPLFAVNAGLVGVLSVISSTYAQQVPAPQGKSQEPRVETRQPSSAQLGMQVSPETAEGGVRVLEVTAEGSAARAGVKRGDVIRSIGERMVTNPRDIVDALSKYESGSQVPITVERGNARQQLMAILRPEKTRVAPADPSDSNQRGWLGITLETEKSDARGVAIGSVFPSGPAAAVGLYEGDRIVQINGIETPDADSVIKQIASQKAHTTVDVVVQRGDSQMTLPVELAERHEFFGSNGEGEFGNEQAEFASDIDGIPEHAMRLEGYRRLCEHNERLERVTFELLREVKELRAEVQALKSHHPEPAAPPVEGANPTTPPEQQQPVEVPVEPDPTD